MPKSKSILVKKDGVVYKAYVSMVRAAIDLNLSQTTIKKMCNGYTTVEGYSATFIKGERNDYT